MADELSTLAYCMVVQVDFNNPFLMGVVLMQGIYYAASVLGYAIYACVDLFEERERPKEIPKVEKVQHKKPKRNQAEV